jgi:predicted nuclease of predicted toxin-antitoxin system
MIRILVGMNLGPSWVQCLGECGIEAILHWSSVGQADAPDIEIMKWSSTHEHVVFTHDLDF